MNTATFREAIRQPYFLVFVIIITLGMVMTYQLHTLNVRLNDAEQTVAVLDESVTELRSSVGSVNDTLALGRYERLVSQRDIAMWQAENRRLTCLDLRDGDLDTTPEQIEGCEDGAIVIPPVPDDPRTPQDESETNP